MPFLIDTQILIWFQLNDLRLKESVKEILMSFENTIFVSQVSLMEIAIKQSVGKIPELSANIDDLIDLTLSDSFEILPLTNNHIATYNNVPLYDNHRDPFDRLLIATAMSENFTLISADEKFKLYAAHINLVES